MQFCQFLARSKSSVYAGWRPIDDVYRLYEFLGIKKQEKIQCLCGFPGEIILLLLFEPPRSLYITNLLFLLSTTITTILFSFLFSTSLTLTLKKKNKKNKKKQNARKAAWYLAFRLLFLSFLQLPMKKQDWSPASSAPGLAPCHPSKSKSRRDSVMQISLATTHLLRYGEDTSITNSQGAERRRAMVGVLGRDQEDP